VGTGGQVREWGEGGRGGGGGGGGWRWGWGRGRGGRRGRAHSLGDTRSQLAPSSLPRASEAGLSPPIRCRPTPNAVAARAALQPRVPGPLRQPRPPRAGGEDSAALQRALGPPSLTGPVCLSSLSRILAPRSARTAGGRGAQLR
jgi:hypothetical protein